MPRSGPSRVAFDLLVAVAALGLSTGLIARLDRVATSSSLGEVYLLAVVITAVVSGRVYAVAVAVVSVLLLDYLFLPPEYTLRVGNGDWLALVAFLIVAFVITSLVASRERASSPLAIPSAGESSATCAFQLTGIRGSRITGPPDGGCPR